MRNLIPVDRYSESESQIGNSGSEDNCNFTNSSTISSSNSKEASGKNHTSGQSNYAQNNGTLGSTDSNTSFSNQNGPISNGNLDHVQTPVKDLHNSSKDLNKSRPSNSAKKSNIKRSRNR